MVEGYGLKMTPQRRSIIEFLQTCANHPTAEEILQAVNSHFPMTSRPTVYNTLNWLKGAGLIHEVHEGGTVRYDPNTSPHHHFICRWCGRVDDIESDQIEKIEFEEIAGHYKIEHFQITVRGLCLQCQ
jgi:Fur family peroxide stress response transcriptional regulator